MILHAFTKPLLVIPESRIQRAAHRADGWWPVDGTFTVELLAGEDDEGVREALNQIDFLLVEKGESNPWNYACHHCTTAANLYSSIHWNWHAGT